MGGAGSGVAGPGATQLAGVRPARTMQVLSLDEPTSDRSRYEGAHDDGEGCCPHRDLGCMREPHRLRFLRPRCRGSGPPDERDAADQQAIKRMGASNRGHQDANDVLNDQEDDRNDAQDDERSTTRLQRRELG